VYTQKIGNGGIKHKRRSVNPISYNNIIQAQQLNLNNHMQSQPIDNSSPKYGNNSKKFNAWKTLQDFSPARKNRNATGLLTVNQTKNVMLSPIHIASGEMIRDEMSKTPTYRTDLGNPNNNNSLILNKNSGVGLDGQVTSQRMVQIIENSS
jgi:hypothetical protein